MQTSKHEAEQNVATRLGRAGRRVDLLVARVRGAADRFNGRVARRVDALRAHEARVHTRLREMREADEAAWAEHGAELGRELDELEAQMAIAEMRLEAERATDDAAFRAAVNAELDAWSAYADAVQARAASVEGPLNERLDAPVRSLRERLADARRSIHAPPAVSPQGVPTDHEAVRRAVWDLDRAAEEIASAHGHVR